MCHHVVGVFSATLLPVLASISLIRALLPLCGLLRYPLGELLGALEELFPKQARPAQRGRHGRHVLLEYVMLRDINDSLSDAARLLALVARIECKVNLICFNAHAGTPFRPSAPRQVRRLLRQLPLDLSPGCC